MSISSKLNWLMPGVQHVERIKDDRVNPNRLQSMWLGFSVGMAELPVLLVMHIVMFLYAIAIALCTFIATIGMSFAFVGASLILGVKGKMERRDHE